MANSVGRMPQQAAPPKHINDLPHLVLKHILDRLPLVDLVHQAGRVCRRWSKVQQMSCKNRHMLMLISANDAPNTFYCSTAKLFIIKTTLYRDFTHQNGEATETQTNVLKVFSYSLLYIKEEACLDSVERIAQLFPSITHLQVSVYVKEQFGLPLFTTLLKHYGSQLVSLKLHSLLIITSRDEAGFLTKMQHILDTIGAQLPKLAYLTLALDGCFDNLFSLATSMPVFPRLRQLFICTAIMSGVFLKPSLLQFDARQLENLRQPIKLHRHLSSGCTFAGFPNSDARVNIEDNSTIDYILSSVIWAQFHFSMKPFAMLNKLTGLKGLYINTQRYNATISQEQFFSQLARLDSLVYLYVHAFYTNWSHPSIYTQVLPSLSPLRSIRWLKLKWELKDSHDDFLLRLQLPHTFPQLHTLTLRCAWQECYECYPKPIFLKDFENYPERCWRRLEAEVSEIYAQMPWLARLDYKCSAMKAADLEFPDTKDADESDPEPFLYSRVQFSREQPREQ